MVVDPAGSLAGLPKKNTPPTSKVDEVMRRERNASTAGAVVMGSRDINRRGELFHQVVFGDLELRIAKGFDLE